MDDKKITKNGCSSSKSSWYQHVHHFRESSYICIQELFGILINQESHSLVGSLFQDSWKQPFVNSSETALFDDRRYSMDETMIFGFRLEAIMNQFHLQCFCWSHHQNCFCDSCSQSSEKCMCSCFFLSKKHSFLNKNGYLWSYFKDMILEPFVRTESWSSFGDRKEDQSRKTSVEPKNAIFLIGRTDDIFESLFGIFWEKLHLCLHVFSGICYTNLNTACDTTCYNSLKRVLLQVRVAMRCHLMDIFSFLFIVFK